MRGRAGLVALTSLILAALPQVAAQCSVKDVDVLLAATPSAVDNYVELRDADGYRMVYSSVHRTNAGWADFRYNYVNIRNSKVVGARVLGAIAGSLKPKPGFCATGVSAYISSRAMPLMSVIYEECDSIFQQEIVFHAGVAAFQKAASERYATGFTLRTFAASATSKSRLYM